jgi:hypothetical protein
MRPALQTKEEFTAEIDAAFVALIMKNGKSIDITDYKMGSREIDLNQGKSIGRQVEIIYPTSLALTSNDRGITFQFVYTSKDKKVFKIYTAHSVSIPKLLDLYHWCHARVYGEEWAVDNH